MNLKPSRNSDEFLAAAIFAEIASQYPEDTDIAFEPPFATRPGPMEVIRMASERVNRISPPPSASDKPIIHQAYMSCFAARFASTELARSRASEQTIDLLLSLPIESTREQLFESLWAESTPAIRDSLEKVLFARPKTARLIANIKALNGSSRPIVNWRRGASLASTVVLLTIAAMIVYNFSGGRESAKLSDDHVTNPNDWMTVYDDCPFVPEQPANVGVTTPEIRAGQKYKRNAIEEELGKQPEFAFMVLVKVDDEKIQTLALRAGAKIIFNQAFLDDMAADMRNCNDVFVLIESNQPCTVMDNPSEYFEPHSPGSKLENIRDPRELGESIQAFFSSRCPDVPLKFSVWRAKHRT